MKQSFFFLALLILLSLHTTRGTRLLTPKQGKEEVIDSGFSQLGHSEEDDPWKLMGLEDCDNGDEECLKRRMLSEAHLDYIYTQHKNP
ncbi:PHYTOSULFOKINE 3 PRECURSOR [Tasmannia lanceolata]|uniref:PHYTOSULFOKINE 3 PRECURSOR n=1 Tax=Tasmannia lanceolata TaxID=3420 RepID=UPI00406326FF